MVKYMFLLIFSMLSIEHINSQQNILNLNFGYGGLVDGDIDGVTVGANYKFKIKNFINFGFEINSFYGTGNLLIFPNSNNFNYKILAISEKYIHDGATLPKFEEKYSNTIENQGIINLDEKIGKYFYLPITLNISKPITIHKKHKIIPTLGFGIMYLHSRSLFIGKEGLAVINSADKELDKTNISVNFEYYYRMLLKVFSFDISYTYNFSKNSFIGIGNRIYLTSKRITELLQLNFIIGTQF